jgi:hypothetical protein
MRVRRLAVPALAGALTMSGATAVPSALAATSAHAHGCSSSGQSTFESGPLTIGGVAAGPGCTVWAVGTDASGAALYSWTGHSWRRTHVSGLAEVSLAAVTASSGSTWAVGSSFNAALVEPVVLQLGKKGWHRITAPAPGVGAYGNALSAVAASGSEALAVGASYTTSSFTSQALVLRWNGKKWYAVPTPAIADSVLTDLDGVALSSANYGWAVGQSDTGTNPQPLIEHWNGKRWSVQASPVEFGTLKGVTALSAKDAWAVGYQETASGNAALIEHWNGKRWSLVPNPSLAVYKGR